MRWGTPTACRLTDAKIGTFSPCSFSTLIRHHTILQRAIRNGRCLSGVMCTVSKTDNSAYTAGIAVISHVKALYRFGCEECTTLSALFLRWNIKNYIFGAGPNPRCAVNTVKHTERKARQKVKCEDCHIENNLWRNSLLLTDLPTKTPNPSTVSWFSKDGFKYQSKQSSKMNLRTPFLEDQVFSMNLVPQVRRNLESKIYLQRLEISS